MLRFAPSAFRVSALRANLLQHDAPRSAHDAAARLTAANAAAALLTARHT